MMTQPIRYFLDLTSETAQAQQLKAPKSVFSGDEIRMLELRARHVRAEMVGNLISDAIVWVSRKVGVLHARIKADLRLRHAEAQLFRMSDRELSDLGLCRADIEFAVREAAEVEGLAPQIDVATGTPMPANQTLRRGVA